MDPQTRAQAFANLIYNAMQAVVIDAGELIPEIQWNEQFRQYVASRMTAAAWAVLETGLQAHAEGAEDQSWRD